MSVLRSNQLGLEDEEAVNASSAVEILQAFDNNAEVDENISVIDEHKWQEDIGERGRRIAEWWSSLMIISNGEWLPCFERMHVLMSLLRQPSSAIVERAFSQVNCIRSVCRDNLKEDNLEIRALLRCNSNCDACDY